MTDAAYADDAVDADDADNGDTLVHEDTNIPTDDVNRAFIGNVSMQVATTSGQSK